MINYIRFLFIILLFLPAACKNTQLSQSMQKKVYLSEIANLENDYKSTVWTIRKNAVLKCGEYPSERTMQLLIRAVNDTHTSIQAEAVNQLSIYDNNSAFNTLINISQDRTRSDIVRISALNGLSRYKSEKAFPVFLDNINDKNNLIRQSAYRGLLRIEDKKIQNLSIDYIILGLNDESTSVQMTVLDEIHIKSPLIYKIYKDFLTSKENHNKNTMMIKILKGLSGYDIDDELEQTLRSLLTNNNTEIRLLSLKVLKSQPRLNKKR
ncbi:MAG: HEAT repeat domain-containing protein [Spirochaetes bacterium]|nr:HEAT repeat domain-containing protein [Spirochaetota bacterium]